MRLAIGDSDLLCIDWDERSLRIVNAGLSRSSVQIRSAVHVPFDETVKLRDPATLGEFIRKTLAEHRIRARRVVIDVPRQDAVLNLMALPKGTLSELAAMVHMQIGKELPFSKDQAVVDFAIARREEGSPTFDVWVAAVRNTVIDQLQQAIEAAGLRLERIGLRPYANVVAATGSGIEPGRTLMVDVGPAMTEINVIRDGRLAYSRAASVSIPATGLAEPPPSSRGAGAAGTGSRLDEFISRPNPMDALLVEVSRTIEAYRSTDPGARIDRILLAGTVNLDDAIAQAFANRFGAPTTVFQLPASVKWKAGAQESAPAFSAVIGLAMSMASDTELYFNFIKPKQAEDERRERVRRLPMLAAMVALLVVTVGVSAYMPIRARDRQIAGLEAKIAEANKDQKARQELKKQLDDLEQWRRKNVVWLDVLKRFTDEVMKSNKDAYLTKLDMSETGRINIQLVATNEDVAPQLADAAEAMRDKNGKPVLSATVGDWGDNPRDEAYPVSDEMVLQVRSLVPAAKSRR